MTDRTLLIEVRWLDGRFHGEADAGAPEWPPSPFRLFQALVAGAYGGRWAGQPTEDELAADAAFEWLESLPAPRIASAPRLDDRKARATTYFVPNNDLDAKGGDPRAVADIRVAKSVRPVLFGADRSVLYAWPVEGEAPHAARLCALADRLHTLGRGIDQAYARAELLPAAEADARLEAHQGAISRPSAASSGRSGSPCPARGSLQSLKRRHAALGGRLQQVRDGKTRLTLFRQPPKAHSRSVAYDQPPTRFFFELRQGDGRFQPVKREQAVTLVKAVRDLAHARLTQALPELTTLSERAVMGRGEGVPVEQRMRLIPLPSLGTTYTSPSIRRLLVEVPPDCPLPPGDIAWALSGGAVLGHDADGVVTPEALLIRTRDDTMARRYGVGDHFRHWHSVTPVVLSEHRGRKRGRISGAERVAAEDRAASAVLQALRHAGLPQRPTEIRVQREPFDARGVPADRFQADRFGSGRLMHVALTFSEPLSGPLLIGDGRFLGLGLFAGAGAVHR